MNKILKLITFLTIGACWLFSSCSPHKQHNLLQDIGGNFAQALPPEEYRVISGDQLSIVVYVSGTGEDSENMTGLFTDYSPSLSGVNSVSRNTKSDVSAAADQVARGGIATTIYADGTIKFPYVGKLYVQDLTVLEIRLLLAERLKDLSDLLTLDVQLYNRYFSIIGEATPQRISMPSSSITIFQALALSTSIGEYSNMKQVSIIRQTEDGSMVKTFDLRSQDILNTEFYYIQPNDVIYFPEMDTKIFGVSSSFTDLFSLITSFLTVIVMAFRLF